MTFRQYFSIIMNWVIFIPCFTGWYLEMKWKGFSDGMARDYLFWHQDEYRKLDKFAESEESA